MFTSIESARQSLQIDLNEVRGAQSFYYSLENYLEACFHQMVEHGIIRYFNTSIELSIDRMNDIRIKRRDDDTDYYWLLSPTFIDTAGNYWDDYNDGYFNSTDCDKYVEEVLWTLHETLVENGIIKHKDMLNN